MSFNFSSLINQDTSQIINEVYESDAKGEMLVSNGQAFSLLQPGANGQVLEYNSNAPLGVEWATPSAGGPGGSSSLSYKGTWNGATNTPDLVTGTYDPGDYYIVSTPGGTLVDGVTDWGTGDWIIRADTNVFQKIDNSESPGITDHTLLSNIGVNTHDEIDIHLSDVSKHRVIDDSSTATNSLWSSDKIANELSTKTDTGHTHAQEDVILDSGTLSDFVKYQANVGLVSGGELSAVNNSTPTSAIRVLAGFGYVRASSSKSSDMRFNSWGQIDLVNNTISQGTTYLYFRSATPTTATIHLDASASKNKNRFIYIGKFTLTGDTFSDIVYDPTIIRVPLILSDLADINTSGAVNTQVLSYNNGLWEPSNLTAPPLSALTDTTITAPVDNQALVYQSGTWINQNVASSINALSEVPDVSTNAPVFGSNLRWDGIDKWEPYKRNFGSVGTGADIIKTSDYDVQYRTITGSGGITVTEGIDQITVDGSGISGGSSSLEGLTDTQVAATPNLGDVLTYSSITSKWVNVPITGNNNGSGEQLYKNTVGVELNFKSLVAGVNIDLNSGVDEITINALDDAGSLKTTGTSVTVSSSNPPTAGQILTSTSSTSAEWADPVPSLSNFDDYAQRRNLGLLNVVQSTGPIVKYTIPPSLASSVISLDGKYIYGAAAFDGAENSNLRKIDLDTGSFSTIPVTIQCAGKIQIGADGKILLTTPYSNQFRTVDTLNNDALGPIQILPASNTYYTRLILRNGDSEQYWFFPINTSQIVKVDAETLVQTNIGACPFRVYGACKLQNYIVAFQDGGSGILKVDLLTDTITTYSTPYEIYRTCYSSFGLWAMAWHTTGVVKFNPLTNEIVNVGFGFSLISGGGFRNQAYTYPILDALGGNLYLLKYQSSASSTNNSYVIDLKDNSFKVYFNSPASMFDAVWDHTRPEKIWYITASAGDVGEIFVLGKTFERKFCSLLAEQIRPNYLKLGNSRFVKNLGGAGEDVVIQDENDISLFSVRRDDSNGQSGFGSLIKSAFKLPQLNQIERDILTGMTGGEMVWNTTTNQMNMFNGSVWVILATV